MMESSSPPTPSKPSIFRRRESAQQDEDEPFSGPRRTAELDVSGSPTTMRTPPRQRAYIGSSTAKRLIKRAKLCKTENDAPIFTLHRENKRGVKSLDDPTPFNRDLTHSSARSDNSTSYSMIDGPPALGYSVSCYATHGEYEQKKKEADRLEREKEALVCSINASRRVEGAPILRISPLLSHYAQDWSNTITREDRGSAFALDGVEGDGDTAAQPSRESVEIFVAPTSGSRVARLESPPGMGALAAAEMWYGGKYRRHLCGVVHTHRADCPCRLRVAFETLMDPCWATIGMGWSSDGRWVVELAE